MTRRWFITGGTPGNFGMAFAEAALETGDRVVLTSRRPQELALGRSSTATAFSSCRWNSPTPRRCSVR